MVFLQKLSTHVTVSDPQQAAGCLGYSTCSGRGRIPSRQAAVSCCHAAAIALCFRASAQPRGRRSVNTMATLPHACSAGAGGRPAAPASQRWPAEPPKPLSATAGWGPVKGVAGCRLNCVCACLWTAGGQTQAKGPLPAALASPCPPSHLPPLVQPSAWCGPSPRPSYVDRH